MSNVYWALIAVAAVSVVLGIIEHFGGRFLRHIASPRAFLWFADTCLLMAIALVVGRFLKGPESKEEGALPESGPTE